MQLMSHSMVFQIVGGCVVVSPARGGLFVDFVYSAVPGAFFRDFEQFKQLVRSMGYRQVFCRPQDLRLQRIYCGRLGFQSIGTGLPDDCLVLELGDEAKS